jgi:signal recognition particle GTPase
LQTIGTRIAKALTPEEIADPSLIRAKEKLRIAATVGCDVAKVNAFMDGFESTRAMNEWARGRKSKGLPLPTTLEDFAQLIQQDRVGMGGEVQKKRLKDGMRRGGIRAILKKEVNSGRM